MPSTTTTQLINAVEELKETVEINNTSVQESLNRLQDKIIKQKTLFEKNEKSVTQGVKAVLGTGKSIISLVHKINKGDAVEIADGVLGFLQEASQFATVAGPPGVIFATIFSGLLQVVRLIIGEACGKESHKESQEQMFRRVITQALRNQTKIRLVAEGKGELKMMTHRIDDLQRMVSQERDLDSTEITHLESVAYWESGLGHLGRIGDYITKRASNAQDAESGEEVAAYIASYVTVAVARVQILFLMTCVYNMRQDHENARNTVHDTIAQMDNDKKTFAFLQGRPTKQSHWIMAKLYQLPAASRTLVESYFGMEGKTCRLYDATAEKYLTGMSGLTFGGRPIEFRKTEGLKFFVDNRATITNKKRTEATMIHIPTDAERTKAVSDAQTKTFSDNINLDLALPLGPLGFPWQVRFMGQLKEFMDSGGWKMDGEKGCFKGAVTQAMLDTKETTLFRVFKSEDSDEIQLFWIHGAGYLSYGYSKDGDRPYFAFSGDCKAEQSRWIVSSSGCPPGRITIESKFLQKFFGVLPPTSDMKTCLLQTITTRKTRYPNPCIFTGFPLHITNVNDVSALPAKLIKKSGEDQSFWEIQIVKN